MSTYFIQQKEKYDTTPGAPAATTSQLLSLLHQVSEHFGCFVLYAYDFNGNPLKVGVQTSHMEDSALRSFVKADALGELVMYPHSQMDDDEFDDIEGDWDEDGDGNNPFGPFTDPED